MKLNTYTKLFLKQRTIKPIISKKLNVNFKRYLCGSRAYGHFLLEYDAFMLLFRKMTLFIQSSTRAKTPFVFFFDKLYCSAMYQELASSCNELVSYVPLSYKWLTDWHPDRIGKASSPLLLVTGGVGIFSSTVNYTRLLFALVNKGWPLILTIPVEAQTQPFLYFKSFFVNSIFAIPSTHPSTITQQYFYASYIASVILLEKSKVSSSSV